MPWVNEEMCTACGTCLDECPVGAIGLESQCAVIDEQKCVRCGRCHDVCPFEAVRHDSERIPQEVEANVQWARKLMDNFQDQPERAGVLERVRRYFKKEMKVVDETLQRLEELGG
jgi:ferredoxin